MFDQQLLAYSSDSSKIAFIMSLLEGRSSALAVALYSSRSLVSPSFPLFISEMRKVFDHHLCNKEVTEHLLSLRHGGSVEDFALHFWILAVEIR